jgi:uncharacterized RDD family membrane protein YckC
VNPYQGYERVVTPEAVPLDLDVAGLGSRAIAIAIDMAIQLAAFIAIAFVLAAIHPDETTSLIIVLVSAPTIFWGYFFLFEGLWHGRTPGKRSQRLRVTRTDGQPMSGAQMAVRNLVRIVDFLPAYYAIGCIAMVVSKRSQRLGDLAAGTLVLREPKPFVPRPMDAIPAPPAVLEETTRIDVTGMTEAHYQLLRSYLERRASLDAAARVQVAREIAAAIAPVVRTPEPLSDDALLEATAAAYQRRSGRGY